MSRLTVYDEMFANEEKRRNFNLENEGQGQGQGQGHVVEERDLRRVTGNIRLFNGDSSEF